MTFSPIPFADRVRGLAAIAAIRAGRDPFPEIVQRRILAETLATTRAVR